MITAQQSDLIQQIQSLTIAGFEQTGIHICHNTFIGKYGVDSIVHMFSDDPAMYATTSKHPPSNYTTLEQQRDELASWIANNRREEVA